uniref:Integrase catalytic domain-containing protein n=1 Tax=Triticum urartu TaxID=4572 RepID=A0A8R7UD06_TRIUA
MKQTVKAYVAECAICKQAKPEHVKYPRLLQPLPVPKQAWEMVTLDFVEGLPTSKRFNSILVVVDKLTRYAHFVPLRHLSPSGSQGLHGQCVQIAWSSGCNGV